MYLYRQPLNQTLEACPQLAAWHGLGEPPQRAKQIYAAQSQVRELTDRGFQNIFYDRGKLIVVAFWADSCRPCDAVASTVVSVAQKIAQGPHAKLVKFYHAQWDPAVNPRLHTRYGFKNIPVVFFYYMSSGKQPSNEAPLLEAATRGDRFDTDAASYLRNIEIILRRHGHHAPAKIVPPTKTIAQSQGWQYSKSLVPSNEFKLVDQMLIAPSRASSHFDRLYRANPKLRLSRLARIVDRAGFDRIYQSINGQLPAADTLGVVNPRTHEVFLLSMNVQLQVYLNSAVHEAVHIFACRSRGHFEFLERFGFALNEGFTQLVTEDILAFQNVTMNDRPYAPEREMAEKLVDKLGFAAVADDYFRCTRNVLNLISAQGKFIAFTTLRTDAEGAKTEAIKKQKYREMLRLLDGLPRLRK